MLLLPGDEYSMMYDGYYNFARTLPDCRYCAARSATSMAAPTLEIYLPVSLPFVRVHPTRPTMDRLTLHLQTRTHG